MGIPYRVQPVDIFNGEQFDPAFLKVNPNSRIPAIVDPAGAGGEPISVLNPVCDLGLPRRENRNF